MNMETVCNVITNSFFVLKKFMQTRFEMTKSSFVKQFYLLLVAITVNAHVFGFSTDKNKETTVEGIVMDVNKDAIIGALVFISANTSDGCESIAGAQSDEDGKFKLVMTKKESIDYHLLEMTVKGGGYHDKTIFADGIFLQPIVISLRFNKNWDSSKYIITTY
ncbi:MAG: carboxypeptidase regulatory-like domain-containing protein [Sphingobacteriales bacterium]|nr:MAG: carboxypeptidase regulatory-like domain-containing protein [Sphingobacteriales bacterium]